jgi:hypothetical protein
MSSAGRDTNEDDMLSSGRLGDMSSRIRAALALWVDSVCVEIKLLSQVYSTFVSEDA